MIYISIKKDQKLFMYISMHYFMANSKSSFFPTPKYRIQYSFKTCFSFYCSATSVPQFWHICMVQTTSLNSFSFIKKFVVVSLERMTFCREYWFMPLNCTSYRYNHRTTYMHIHIFVDSDGWFPVHYTWHIKCNKI